MLDDELLEMYLFSLLSVDPQLSGIERRADKQLSVAYGSGCRGAMNSGDSALFGSDHGFEVIAAEGTVNRKKKPPAPFLSNPAASVAKNLW
jgi:hypothetical protein